MKKKGFTLIELVVVVAIILLLAATLAPKLRNEVAKARDAKAVAALGSIRTAVNVYLADNGEGAAGIYGTVTSDDGFLIDDTDDSSEYLETSVVSYLGEATSANGEDAGVAVGGHKESASDKSVTFGGGIIINYDPDDVSAVLSTSGDGVTFDTTELISEEFDTKGNEWIKY